MTDKIELKEIQVDSIPSIEDNALDYLKTLTSGGLDSVCFDDNLSIFSLNGEKIGKFTVSVSKETFNREECFHVQAKSNGTHENIQCGTELDAYISYSFETLQQHHHEYIKSKSHPIDRKTHISKESHDEFLVSQYYTDSKQENVHNKYRVKKNLLKGFISEGANLLLQRLMIQKNLLENFKLFTFDSNVHPCYVSYKPLDKRVTKIEDEQYEIFGLERSLESISEIQTTWQMYFTADGHMVNRIQVGSPSVIKIVEKPIPIEIDEYLDMPLVGKKELNWEEDMEMYSKFLDRKDELMNEYEQYMHDHEDLRNLLGDFMQSILMHKPDNVVHFATKFFAPYSTKTKSNNFLPSMDSTQNIPKKN